MAVRSRSIPLEGDVSPMSQCKARGIHYMVKDKVNGFACLLCGLTGQLVELQASPCGSSPSAVPSPAESCTPKGFEKRAGSSSYVDHEHERALAKTRRALQEENDLKMARELQELEQMEHELTQQALLEQLEVEELELQSLMNQVRAEELKAKVLEDPSLLKRLQHCPNTPATTASSAGGSPSALPPLDLPYGTDNMETLVDPPEPSDTFVEPVVPETLEQATQVIQAEQSENTEQAKQSEQTKSVEQAKQSEQTENTEQAKQSEQTKSAEQAEPEQTKSTEQTEHSEQTKNTEQAEQSEQTKNTEQAEHSQNAVAETSKPMEAGTFASLAIDSCHFVQLHDTLM
ncbi:unnamed protein product [Symbiodinium sp. CCMP2592]|nr:unnamed protein product [Symbiodinium sp. CCMP2592]